jgi:hypothetical protein
MIESSRKFKIKFCQCDSLSLARGKRRRRRRVSYLENQVQKEQRECDECEHVDEEASVLQLFYAALVGL